MDFDVEQIRHTLSAILHAQHETAAAELLDASKAEIAHAGYDFGAETYSLNLRIPAHKFGILESSLGKIEKKIREKVFKLGLDGNITDVNIYPEPAIAGGAITVPVPTRTDENRIWQPNRVRMFLSHISKFKVPTSALKQALATYGIDAFVAHEDIQPTLEWRREIEFALRSMHMLCAIMTEGFNTSQWADQEVGFALGRPVPVIAIRCGTDPYGLLGKHQALPADIGKLEAAAPSIANVVAQQETLITQLIEGAVDATCRSYSFQQSKDGMRFLSKLSGAVNADHALRLLEAARDNFQVREAHGVPAQIVVIAEKLEVELPAKTVANAEFDDDIPF